VFSVLQSKRTEVVCDLTPDRLAPLAADDEILRAVRALNLRSVVAVPLLSYREVLGVIALGFESERPEPAATHLAEKLAQRVAQALENARLYRAMEQALALRNEVLRVVAHDLRNPLGVIQMQASLLRKQVPDTGSKRIEAIERAGERMNRLIQDLLDVQVGRHPIAPARVTAGPVVCECADAQRVLAATKRIELRALIADDLPDVWADRDRLLQVLENLIGNALKFTCECGRIDVGAQPRDGQVLFWVEDSGSGIAEADMPHLFDPFWQAHSSTRSGAGLGLPIAKGIIEAHGGRMWAESTLGRGSTFFFTLPTAARKAQVRTAAYRS
jgi:signal transduction histidine kinase